MPSPTAVAVTGPLVGVIGGTMHAQLTATVALPGGGVRAGGPLGPVVDATISATGTFTLPLLATDDVGTSPTGQAYRLWGDLYTTTGSAQLAPALYELLAAGGPSVPLDSLTPLATTPPAGATYVTRGQWLTLNGFMVPDATTIVQNPTTGAISAQGVASVPSGPAGGVLSGTYPNPGFAADMATQAELDAALITARRETFNFTATGAAWYTAEGAETWDTVGTAAGTFTTQKSVAATPDTFSAAALPVTLAAGDTLQVTCTALRAGPPARGIWRMRRTA